MSSDRFRYKELLYSSVFFGYIIVVISIYLCFGADLASYIFKALLITGRISDRIFDNYGRFIFNIIFITEIIIWLVIDHFTVRKWLKSFRRYLRLSNNDN